VDPGHLNKHSYFEEMSDTEVDVIAGSMREDAWWDGTTILEQGDQGGGVYFLLEGVVRIQHRLQEGEIVQVGRLQRGAVFGFLGVIDGAPRAASCVAQGKVRCAVMDRIDFIDLITGGSTLALRFQLSILRSLARDIRSTNKMLAELVAVPACVVSFEDLIEVFPETEQA
jgi:CRP/FNR family transcriptional regulator